MFLDANIFIYAFRSQERMGAACQKLIKRTLTGEQQAATSVLVMDEVFFYFLNHRGREFAKKVWNNILDNHNIRILSVDEKVAREVLRYVDAGLEPRDALHAATMKANRIDTLCSYDKGFDQVKGLKRQEPR
jgi:predicted nucleic acid-binding protein